MRRPSAAIVALIVFALVDVGLVWMAVQSTSADATGQTPSTVAASAPTAQGTTEEPSQDAPTQQPKKSAPGKVIVSAISHNRAWRAVTDSMTCTQGAEKATIGHTEDAGNSWTRVTVPMVTVSGLSFDSGRMIATGLDTSCEPVTYALTSSTDPDQIDSTDVWRVSPTDSATLEVGGDKAAQQPCSDRILDVAASSTSAATVLCRNGAIQRSTDAGQSWSSRGTVKDALAIGTASAGETVYVVARADCGLAVGPLTEGSRVTASCVEGTKGLKGPVDATIVGSTLWLISKDATVATPVSGLA